MLTQPVLVARLSTHAWALGKGPALFSLRHRDGEKPWKSWVLPQECVRMCACVRSLGWVLPLLKEQTWGTAETQAVGNMLSSLNYQMNLLPLPPLHRLLFPHSPQPPRQHLPLLIIRLLESCCPWCWKFHHTFCACLFGVPGSGPFPGSVALQKQCIQFVSTKSVPALGSPTQKGELYHSRRFKKAAGNTACAQKQ